MRLGKLKVTSLVLSALFLAGCMVASSSQYSESFTSSGGGGGNEVEIRDLTPVADSPTKLAGKWDARFNRPDDHHVQFKVIGESNGSRHESMYGGSSGNDGLEKLARGRGPVNVVFRRDAGTLTFDGTAENAHGAGDVIWEADANYVAEIGKITGETIGARRALELGLVNLELAYARGMADAGYKMSSGDLIGMKFAGVTPEYAKALRDGGYNFSPDDLRGLRFGGVDAAWARKFHDAGYDFSANDLRGLRFGGVDADEAAAYRRAGYHFSCDELRGLRFGGVSAGYAAALAEAGYKFSPDELRRLRFTGVGDDFAVALKKAGYDFSAEQLARLRFSGVSAEYASALAVPGHQNLSAEEIINLRRRGVDAETIRKLRQ